MAGEVCSLKCCLMDVPGGVAEEVSEVLLAYGAQSVAVEEFRPRGGQEQEIFADDGGRVWDRCTVIAYFPPEVRRGPLPPLLHSDVQRRTCQAATACYLPGCCACMQADAATVLSDTASDFGLGDRQHRVEPVTSQDWEQSIKARAAAGTRPAGCRRGAATPCSRQRRPCVHCRTATSLQRWARACG